MRKSIIITLCLAFLCTGCSPGEDYTDAQLGTITTPAPVQSTAEPNPETGNQVDDSMLTPDESSPDTDTSERQSFGTDNATDNDTGEIDPETSAPDTITGEQIIDYRGEGVPHTTRTRATLDYNSDVSGKVYGIITDIAQDDEELWYITLTEVAREEAAPVKDPQGIEHKTINAVPTGKMLTVCIGSRCSIYVWEPYSDYSYGAAKETMQDVEAVMGNQTTYGEPYYFELTLRSGIAYELSLWRAFYDYQLYRHGLAGVIYDDSSALGVDGGMLPEVADKYNNRSETGVIVEPRPTPTPVPNMLNPQTTINP